ncbi:hypothetical protein PsorP6_011576 [Peronosclerospora sorghi]|uniref:Uncharacterized protein n=1 Tax=Peronosclerospora sorghi TaxID=230839 RepID=A0ACC0WM31_9STRA|nr:hypothetical protein PsorP6_011576 [Peronosclerospora sorghi]
MIHNGALCGSISECNSDIERTKRLVEQVVFEPKMSLTEVEQLMRRSLNTGAKRKRTPAETRFCLYTSSSVKWRNRLRSNSTKINTLKTVLARSERNPAAVA